jgi:hypothetical protein
MSEKTKHKAAIRVVKAVVRHVRAAGKAKREENGVVRANHEVHARWLAISAQLQQISNMLYREWIAFHTARGHHVAVREYMAAKRAWNQTPKKERGGMERPAKCEVNCWPDEFGKTIVKTLSARFPDVNLRPLGLAVHKIMGTLKEGGGVRSAFPRWMQMLADEIGPPSFARPLPIPLDNARVRLFAPDDDHPDWRMEFRVDRYERDNGSVTSSVDIVTLKTKGYCRQIFERIGAGELPRKGANLCYSGDKNEWFVQVGYQMPKDAPAELDGRKTAIVRFGEIAPVLVTIDNRDIPVGGKGGNVRYRRASIQQEWNSRNASYRWSRPPRKGRGRGRATELLNVLKGKWARFCKDTSYRLVARVAELVQEHRCGRVVLEKPEEKDKEGLLLWSAGQIGHTQAGRGWPLYFFEQAFQRKCNGIGAELSVTSAVRTDEVQ